MKTARYARFAKRSSTSSMHRRPSPQHRGFRCSTTSASTARQMGAPCLFSSLRPTPGSRSRARRNRRMLSRRALMTPSVQLPRAHCGLFQEVTIPARERSPSISWFSTRSGNLRIQLVNVASGLFTPPCSRKSRRTTTRTTPSAPSPVRRSARAQAIGNKTRRAGPACRGVGKGFLFTDLQVFAIIRHMFDGPQRPNAMLQTKRKFLKMDIRQPGGDKLDRREWLRRCGRVLLFTAVSAGALRLVLRRQVPLTDQTCANRGVCPSCSRRAHCGLPAALSRRRALEGRS